MSAVPEPSVLKPDAKRIRREIKRLSQEQHKALQMAIDVVMSPAEQNQYDERHKEIVNLLTQLTAIEAGDFSKLSAKMIELSLQEERGAGKSPLFWLSSGPQRTAQPSFKHTEGTESVLRKDVPATTQSNRQQTGGTSHARMNQWFLTGSRILGLIRLAAERTVMRRPIGSLSIHLSRSTARAAKSVADQILTKAYRCGDCGGEIGVRSRPRTFTERYILPLLLTQPVRCVACFRRDYCLILTTVRKRSHRDDGTIDHIHRHAA